MRKLAIPAECEFNGWDRRRLCKAMSQTREARFFRRVQAVLLAAQGRALRDISQITGLSRRTVYYLLTRYCQSHQVENLADKPRVGRPVSAPELTRRRILQAFQCSPFQLGYRTQVWTVSILAHHLNERYDCAIGPWALRQRMKHIGLRCKRPRYFYSERATHIAQKKGGQRAQAQTHAA